MSRTGACRAKLFAHLTLALAACALAAQGAAPRRSGQKAAPQSRPSGSKSSESKTSKSERPRQFQLAAPVPADAPKGFEFRIGRYSYRVNVTGNGYRHKGKEERGFNLRFGPGEEVSYLYFAKLGGDLLLLCEIKGARGGTSYVLRLEQPSMRARWTTNVPATATGEPAFDDRRLYVTGKNFVGAYDIETGEFLWLLDKFPGRADEFAAFDAPEPRGREVLFRTRPDYNGTSRTIVVDKKSGLIVRAE